MPESMSKRTKDYISGYYDFNAMKEEGMLQGINEEKMLDSKSELYQKGWNNAKAESGNRKNKGK